MRRFGILRISRASDNSNPSAHLFHRFLLSLSCTRRPVSDSRFLLLQPPSISLSLSLSLQSRSNLEKELAMAAMELEVDGMACGSSQEYQAALEEERRKIIVFRRELPLSLDLVTQAIERIRKQRRQHLGSREAPVLEEFIPLKPCSGGGGLSSTEEEDEDGRCFEEEKTEWLRSVQLWCRSPQHIATGEVFHGKPAPVDAPPLKIGGAFRPFDREKRIGAAPSSAAVSGSTVSVEAGLKCGAYEREKESEKEGNSQFQRKTRRCWSQELHRRFVHALQQLGGSHAATPKQIRELMNVDGLTNDEVKSHLQKYRLHNRRTASAVRSSKSSNNSQTQLLLVGGAILVRPSEYAAVDTQPSCIPVPSPCALYAPIARSPEATMKNKHTKMLPAGPHPLQPGSGAVDGDDDDEEATELAGSPSTSSSSPATTTASPPRGQRSS